MLDMNEHSFNTDPDPRRTALRDGTRTRERIERAALKLFVEQGVAETSIREISREAGISQGAMYNHFESKDELAWSLFAEHFSEIGQELYHRAQEQESLEAKFRAMIAYVFERFDQDWLLVSYVFLARHLHLKRVTRSLGNPYVAFRAVIASAIRGGEIPRQDTDLAASMVVGAIIQVIDTKILGVIKGKLAGKADATAEACARLLQA
jgi:AcrR family transcriptional regulator